MATENVHATGIVLDGIGLILRGPSGAGKSLLALALLDQWEARGLPARLVSDDRVDIVRLDGSLIMRAPKAIEGLIELRGRGIVGRPFLAMAPLHLVIDLVDVLERMVEEEALVTDLLGLSIAHAPVPRARLVDVCHQMLLVKEAVRALHTATGPTRQKTT